MTRPCVSGRRPGRPTGDIPHADFCPAGPDRASCGPAAGRQDPVLQARSARGELNGKGLRGDATLVPVRVRFADALDAYWVRDQHGLRTAAEDAMRILNLSADVDGPPW
ncbi:hypothetical protein ACF1G0_22950 [Streptomyces sp. NPDC013953]|uniref:hypothetical protein n=1 Tax=Streptomyces sp. NPDC013953 TaxID=3364868 RepID=UPI0036FB64F2